MRTTPLVLALALLAGCGIPLLDAPASPAPAEITYEYSEGSCAADADCSWAGEACGGGHGVCTNNPKKYEGALSTCDVNPNFPTNRGFACGCVAQRCGWRKG